VLENLVKSFEPRARAIIGYHRIPPHEGEDLVQQTYLTYLQRRDEVRHPEAWLAGTLRRRCLMFWRSQRRGWLRTADDAFLESRGALEALPQDRVDLRTDLSRVIARLPRGKRDLVRLRFGLGCENREVAERLGYRYSGIYTITKRCLAILARELRALGYEDAGIEEPGVDPPGVDEAGREEQGERRAYARKAGGPERDASDRS
jgi:RNA polymerase sigma-70 factor (ECF subfamily)